MKDPKLPPSANRFARRVAFAAGAVVVASALGGIPADAAQKPVKDLTAKPIVQTGPVPGGFASWNDLLATQQRLVDAAQRITTATTGKAGAGFAGIIAAPENHELRVFWKGNLPKSVDSLVGELRGQVPISVRSAPYTARGLQKEATRLAHKGGDAISSIAPKADGSGLLVSGTSVASARSLAADSAVPVTVEASSHLTPASRWDDTAPWWGGGAWRNTSTGGGCSTGFAVNYGGAKMLTAGHCGDVGQGTTDPTGQAIGTISSDNNGLDVALIDASSAGRVFNNTAGSPPPSEFSNPVIGTTGSFVGMWVCTSGAYSGTNCSIQVQQVNVTINVGYLITGTVRAEQSAHTNAVGQGDSGGSVEVVNTADTSQVYAAGVNTAIDTTTAVPCTGYVTTGRTCAWRTFYTPWSNATAAFPGISIITG